MIGVYDGELVPAIAEVLAELGAAHALVVHGDDGLDELTDVASTFCRTVPPPEGHAADIPVLGIGGITVEGAREIADITRRTGLDKPTSVV